MSKKILLDSDEIMKITDPDEFKDQMTLFWISCQQPRELFAVASLFFECEHCGECCTAMDSIAINEDEINRISEILHISKTVFIQQYTEENRNELETSLDYYSLKRPCPFHIDNRCSIYSYRPHACIMFPCFTSLQDCNLIMQTITVDPTCIALKKSIEYVKKNKKNAYQKETDFLDKFV